MAPLAGTYEFESQENNIPYLQALGMSLEDAKKSESQGIKLVIGPVESDKITLTFGDYPMVFALNKESEFVVGENLKRKAKAVINGDILTLKVDISGDGSLTDEKIFTATDSGVVINSSTNKGDKSVRRYKRV